MTDIKKRIFIRKTRKALIDRWYKLMKPLGTYLLKREDTRYAKMKEEITEEQASKWLAKSIIDYIVRYPTEEFALIIATWIDEDYHFGYFCIGDSSFSRILKNKKHKTGFYKYGRRIDFQEKVVKSLRTQKGIVVEERGEEFKFRQPINYKKTYFIRIE